jgi:hypothetical protein
MKESPALKLMRIVWSNVQEGTSHSWTRLNGAMSNALKLAIEAGLKFDKNDFATINNEMSGGFWMNSDFGYALAICSEHPSAYQSYETWKGIAPYIWPCSTAGHVSRSWTGTRIHIGAEFVWKGERVKCTNLDSERVIACSYKSKASRRLPKCKTCGKEEWSSEEVKILHRFSITADDFRKARKAIADAKKEAEAKAAALRKALQEREAEDAATATD